MNSGHRVMIFRWTGSETDWTSRRRSSSVLQDCWLQVQVLLRRRTTRYIVHLYFID